MKLVRKYFYLIVFCSTVIYLLFTHFYSANYPHSTGNLQIVELQEVQVHNSTIRCTYFTCFDATPCAFEVNEYPLNRIRVFVYPLFAYLSKTDERTFQQQHSSQHLEIIEAISSSVYAVAEPDKACLLVPNVDLLLLGKETDTVLLQRMLQSSPWWNNGLNHLFFNFISSGSQFDSKNHPNFGLALIASSSHSTTSYRPTFDVLLPAYSPLQWTYSPGTNRQHMLLVLSTKLLDELPATLMSLLKAPRNVDSSMNSSIIVASKCNSQQIGRPSNPLQMCGTLSIGANNAMQQVIISYPTVLTSSVFCVTLGGKNFDRLALYDAMKATCIPVLLDNQYILPFSDVLDWSRFSVRVRSSELERLPAILASYSATELKVLQQRVEFIFNSYFSSLRRIVQTTLDIINDRVFPYYSKSYTEWNEPSHIQTPFPTAPLIFYPPRAPLRVGYTAVVRLHHHFSTATTLLRLLDSAQLLRTVLVVWTNPDVDPPPYSLWPVMHKPHRVLRAPNASVHDRYFPFNLVTTDAILSISETVDSFSVQQIEFAFELWYQNPSRLVSVSGSAVGIDSTGHKVFLCDACFFHKHYAHAYTELISEPLRQVINRYGTCEDVLMSWLITQLSGHSVLSVGKVSIGVEPTFQSPNVHMQCRSMLPQLWPHIAQFLTLDHTSSAQVANGFAETFNSV